MSIWIVTTGNSDVQLTTDEHWVDLYNAAVGEEDSSILEVCDDLISAPTQDRATGLYPAPARALGLVYRAKCFDDYYTDLTFPLLHTFIQGIKERTESDCPSKIIVLLTDQTQIFTPKQKGYTDCPFWQDTVELREILTRYFQNNLGTVPNFYCITPAPAQGQDQTATAGADNWEYMLKKVNETLERALSELGVDRETEETVYVSHQAGTPAISSAVQFLTVSKFKNVKFLVSNQYYQGYNPVSSPDVIESSNYWRGLQIQKAKRLIQNGQPGAALEILQNIPDIQPDIITQLQQLVNRFNIKADDTNKDSLSIDREFEPEAAIKRVRDALDMIEFFFRNENYLPGINLLAAAHETFLKAAILVEVEKRCQTETPLDIAELINWDEEGFFLLNPQEQQDLLTDRLSFPIPATVDKDKSQESSGDYIKWTKFNQKFELNNSRLRKWLRNLISFDEWNLLKWSCTQYRTKKYDLRNQNMHNLRGVEKIDVIRYLLGNPNDAKFVMASVPNAKQEYPKYLLRKQSLSAEEVVEVYSCWVKKPFTKALNDLNLLNTEADEESLEKQIQKIVNLLG
ncbi:hypothetical protein [Kamptonema formosum]|uniref:hypothetical protein n=1 Tax=Kamptonema formosum TaxID=331992 RepID=UPI0003499D53|nr:hypothetical protein [Oscillatoria sp. PCC 10802]